MSSLIPRLASIAQSPDKMRVSHCRDRLPPTFFTLSSCLFRYLRVKSPSTSNSLHSCRLFLLSSPAEGPFSCKLLAIATGRRLTLNQSALKTFLGTYSIYIDITANKKVGFYYHRKAHSSLQYTQFQN